MPRCFATRQAPEKLSAFYWRKKSNDKNYILFFNEFVVLYVFLCNEVLHASFELAKRSTALKRNYPRTLKTKGDMKSVKKMGDCAHLTLVPGPVSCRS